jgi:hypothetical protein
LTFQAAITFDTTGDKPVVTVAPPHPVERFSIKDIWTGHRALLVRLAVPIFFIFLIPLLETLLPGKPAMIARMPSIDTADNGKGENTNEGGWTYKKRAKQLTHLHYAAGDPGSYGGVDRLYARAKDVGIPVSPGEVQSDLAKQLPYSIHKPVRHKFAVIIHMLVISTSTKIFSPSENGALLMGGFKIF